MSLNMIKSKNTRSEKNNSIKRIKEIKKQGLNMKTLIIDYGSGNIESVKNELNIPLIVGGGIRSMSQIEDTYSAGADIIVVGTAFEEDDELFEELKK